MKRSQRYKLPDAEYEAIWEQQRGLCAICKHPNDRDRALNVDHNHLTGDNRALLCDRCNKVLGFVKDSQELLLRLLGYLRQYDGSATKDWVPYTPVEDVGLPADFGGF